VLGESREDARRALWRTLLGLAMPPSLIRHRLDVAQRELDRLLAGAEPALSRWNPYAARRRLAWLMWRTAGQLDLANATAGRG
jgi:hypothetical protein